MASRTERLFVEQLGSGMPVMLMHGGLGFDHTTLRPWLDKLAESARVVYYDHAGNGRSYRPDDWSTLDHARWIDDAEELRRDLGLGRIVLLGHSYGGFLAQEYALRYPDSLAGLVLCCTAPVLDFGPVIFANAEARGTAEQAEIVRTTFSGPVPDDDTLTSVMKAIGSLYFHRTDPALTPGVFGDVRFSGGAYSRAFFGCIQHFDTRSSLHSIRTPTLLMGGADDWIMPVEHGIHRIAEQMSHAEIEVLPASGHFPWAEEPDRFLGVLRAWLRRLDAYQEPSGHADASR